jgi:L-ascorbate metabolism protein UlaG (beta-lactamase superfamily)
LNHLCACVKLELMEITWLGYSCFRLKGKQTTIVTDPCPPDLGYPLGKLTADIVTISHDHPGHSYIQGVGGEPKVLTGPGEYEISGVITQGLQTYHDSEHGTQRGKNIIFVFEIDDVVICHLGDLGHALTTEQVAKIDSADVLLVPVGGVSTIDATHAAEIVRRVEPKIVIPMHYKTLVLKQELAPVDRFLKEMGVKEAIPQPKLVVNKNSLPLTLQVVVLG